MLTGAGLALAAPSGSAMMGALSSRLRREAGGSEEGIAPARRGECGGGRKIGGGGSSGNTQYPPTVAP